MGSGTERAEDEAWDDADGHGHACSVGWGPREGAAAWIFAAAGWGAGAGAAAATAFGVLALVATLPGAAVLLLGRHSRRDAARSARDERDRPPAGVVLSAAGEHGRAYG